MPDAQLPKSPAPKLSEAQWKALAKTFIKVELKRENITYEQLSNLLKTMGIEETVASINNKLSRGTFSATFLFQCMAAIDARLIAVRLGQSTIMENSGWVLEAGTLRSQRRED